MKYKCCLADDYDPGDLSEMEEVSEWDTESAAERFAEQIDIEEPFFSQNGKGEVVVLDSNGKAYKFTVNAVQIFHYRATDGQELT